MKAKVAQSREKDHEVLRIESLSLSLSLSPSISLCLLLCLSLSLFDLSLSLFFFLSLSLFPNNAMAESRNNSWSSKKEKNPSFWVLFNLSPVRLHFSSGSYSVLFSFLLFFYFLFFCFLALVFWSTFEGFKIFFFFFLLNIFIWSLGSDSMTFNF